MCIRDRYTEILDAGFAEIKVGLIPAVVDRVVVGDITRTRLPEIRALFFIGVNDGIVPSVSGRGGILTEAERRTCLLYTSRLRDVADPYGGVRKADDTGRRDGDYGGSGKGRVPGQNSQGN